MKKNKKHLIIGRGEIGSALFNVLKKYCDISIRDKEGDLKGDFDILHICYPPVKNFINITKNYIKEYNPKLVIIHSTIPIGTTQKISSFAAHSPVRGVHPCLEDGIKRFVKYFGGEKAKEAARYFSKIGIKTKVFADSKTTELLKILDTTYYGWNIVFAKEVKRICDELNLNFEEVYTIANQDYNEGYKKMGMNHVIRPILKPIKGKIRGHCIVPNADLLKDWLTDVIKKRNKKY